MPNERIELTDTVMSAVTKLSDGNPGAAITVMAQLIKDTPLIDPDAAFGGFGCLLALDTLNIYGPRIWMLFKDVCRQSIILTVSTLRAWQLGFVTPDQLNNAIDGKGQLDILMLLSKVQEELPAFGGPREVAAIEA